MGLAWGFTVGSGAERVGSKLGFRHCLVRPGLCSVTPPGLSQPEIATGPHSRWGLLPVLYKSPDLASFERQTSERCRDQSAASQVGWQEKPHRRNVLTSGRQL